MESNTVYCGDVCNHTGPHRYRYPYSTVTIPSPTVIVITHCKHGLDLRVHPRCYLCKPLESGSVAGCTCPTFWHGVIPPQCPVHNPPSAYSPNTTYAVDHT